MASSYQGSTKTKLLIAGSALPTPEDKYRLLRDVMHRIDISEAELLIYGGKYIGVKGKGKESEIIAVGKDVSEVLGDIKKKGLLHITVQKLPTWESYKNIELEAELYKLYRQLNGE